LSRLMKAAMTRQIDILQVRTHQLVFIGGRCQQYFVAYGLSLDVSPFARPYDLRAVSAHVNPECALGWLAFIRWNFMGR
jgi:hypothetical protein